MKMAAPVVNKDVISHILLQRHPKAKKRALGEKNLL